MRALRGILARRLDQIGTAHSQLSLVASEKIIERANAVMDTCGRIGQLVDVTPADPAWADAFEQLAITTLELKNALRAEEKRGILRSPSTDGSLT